MKKPKLDTARMQSELSESAFFRRPADQPQDSQAGPLNGSIVEQTFKRANVQGSERALVRASFDIFQDQQQALAEIQTARFKKTGRKPKMGELAQEAFDLYIKAVNERPNE